MYCGASLDDMAQRVASYADVLMEFASTFAMVINLKTAQALGITVAESVRLRVDEVIQ